MSRKITFASALMGLLFLSGCSMYGPKDVSSNQIDPPPLTSQPAGSEKVTTDGQPVTDTFTDPSSVTGAKESAAASTIVSKIYAVDPDGYVVPWEVELPKKTGVAKEVLTCMVQGSEGEKMLPTGFHAVLPPGTKVKSLNIKNGVATVDFSPEFKKYKPENEQKIIDAVTWALTEFDSIKEVNIQINGYPQDVMPVKGTPISHLSRKNGINLEMASNVKIGHTMPVTLYFQGQLGDKGTYFVPVTRLVPDDQSNKADVVLKELVHGPTQGSPLFSSILPTVNVLNVKENNGVIVANLDNKILSYSDKQANPDALEEIVLSLTENTNAKKVQIMVDGKSTVKTGKVDYSKPVSRPSTINSKLY
ncbi:GerMN domain-containing protein [Aneurinibacillus terranovensis]|uniref:GerMN domain-containing protein n=1 Tax=Aneurinibacillus terranovensis TaxID=278991 RepID=UPI00041CF269|nr:GerMN domain-containing protein [Aneurinibacillus terranovensis]